MGDIKVGSLAIDDVKLGTLDVAALYCGTELLWQRSPSTATLTIAPDPSNATVTLTATGYTQVGNSITVAKNTEVSWSVSKQYYTTRNGNYTVTADYTLPIELTPAVPASTDWEYTLEGDDSAILTKYIGSGSVVIGPDYVKGEL